MRVNVDEPWREEQSAQINDLDAVVPAVVADLDATVTGRQAMIPATLRCAPLTSRLEVAAHGTWFSPRPRYRIARRVTAAMLHARSCRARRLSWRLRCALCRAS